MMSSAGKTTKSIPYRWDAFLEIITYLKDHTAIDFFHFPWYNEAAL